MQLTMFDDSTDNESGQGSIGIILRVARDYKFPLQHYIENGVYWYSIQDWLRGVLGKKDVSRNWTDIQEHISDSIEYMEIRKFAYLQSSGKNRDMDFATRRALFYITQDLRSMKDRPAVSEIKDELVNSAEFKDELRTNPLGLMVALQSTIKKATLSKQEKDIEAYKKQGYDTDWIMIRMNGKIARSVLTQAIKDHIQRPEYDTLTNVEYMGLFERTAKTMARQLDTKEPRDKMTKQANLIIDLTETTISDLLGDTDVVDMEQAIQIFEHVAKEYKPFVNKVQSVTGRDIVTGKPLLKSPNI